MTYQQARENLPLYADGELGPQLSAELEEHLAESAKLRAELERWRSLRRCANRVVTASTPPKNLEHRVRADLRHARLGRRYRRLRLFGGSVAIAAAIVLAVLVWPRAATLSKPKLIAADRFAEIYIGCACEHQHRGVPVDLRDLRAARATLAEMKSYPVLLPDLRDHGFELDGVCPCFHVPGVDVVHAYYRRSGPEPAVVSFFSIDQQVHLKDCRCERCTRPAGPDREYEIAGCGDVIVCKWDEAENSFVVCSDMDLHQLRDLADSVEVASLQQYLAVFARAD